MIEISFLVPAYNQTEEIQKCISSVIEYKGSDIEIVVNDDCSEERLDLVAESFHDERIRVCRNNENFGLDGNILCGIENCKGRFIFLLTSTDLAIAESIPYIIEVIKRHSEVVYITGTSLDNDGLPKRIFKENNYRRGSEALSVHWKLHFHPAGSLFRRSAINIELFRAYLNQFREKRLYFMVDQLIRLHMSQEGNFYIINRPIWIYTDRSRNRNLSVHNNIHVYDTDIICQRYENEQMFIANEMDCGLKVKCQIDSFQFWLRGTTWDNLNRMNNEGLRNHYGIPQGSVDIDSERNHFLQYAARVELENSIIDSYYQSEKNKAIEDNILFQAQYDKHLKLNEKTDERSQETLQLIETIKKAGYSIKDVFEKSGYKKIGLYGMGYLGTIIWNEIVGEIKPVYICDKKYADKIMLENGVMAIPVELIQLYDVDVIIVTPMHLAESIIIELANRSRQRIKTIYEVLGTYRNVLPGQSKKF